MAKPRLHLDADSSRKDLHAALISKGHDVTRTPAPGLALDASDEIQLLWASTHDRVLFTFNIGDFLQLVFGAKRAQKRTYPGIRNRTLPTDQAFAATFRPIVSKFAAITPQPTHLSKPCLP